MVLQIPSMSEFRNPKDREIVSFAIWFLSAQLLPALQLEPLVTPIINAIESIYRGSAARSHDKARKAVLEATTAAQSLGFNYPHLFGPAIYSQLLQHIIPQLTAAPLSLRIRSTTAIGSLALGMQKNWVESADASETIRTELADLLQKKLYEFFMSVTLAEVGETVVVTPTASYNTILAMLEAVKEKQEETTWLLATLAMLPIAYNRKFRKIEPTGPRFWMRFIQVRSLTPLRAILLTYVVRRSPLPATMRTYKRLGIASGITSSTPG